MKGNTVLRVGMFSAYARQSEFTESPTIWSPAQRKKATCYCSVARTGALKAVTAEDKS